MKERLREQVMDEYEIRFGNDPILITEVIEKLQNAKDNGATKVYLSRQFHIDQITSASIFLLKLEPETDEQMSLRITLELDARELTKKHRFIQYKSLQKEFENAIEI